MRRGDLMTPHRLHHVTPIASVVRQAFMLPPEPGPAVGVLAGVLALFSSFWSVHIVAFLLLAISASVADLASGAHRAAVLKALDKPGGFDRTRLDRGIWRKFLYLTLSILAGVSVDAIGALIAGGAELAAEGMIQTYSPALSAALLWRFIREWSSTLDNVDSTPGGKDEIAPGIRKFIDALRWKLTPEDGGLPDRRWGDHLTKEQRLWLETQVEQMRTTAATDEAQLALIEDVTAKDKP